jgi:hypothetical protein
MKTINEKIAVKEVTITITMGEMIVIIIHLVSKVLKKKIALIHIL